MPRRIVVLVALVSVVAGAGFLIIRPSGSAETVVTGDSAAHGATIVRYEIRSR